MSAHPRVEDHDNTTADPTYIAGKTNGATAELFYNIDHWLQVDWIVACAVGVFTAGFFVVSLTLASTLDALSMDSEFLYKVTPS